MKKKIKTREPKTFEVLSDHPVLQRVFAARGVVSQAELEYSLKHILPFSELKSIDKAVARLLQALKHRESILIVGDYDTDGATSTAIAVRALRMLGATQVDFLVPDRFRYGYGLSKAIVELAAERKPHLIITVDNGIVSFEGVDAANAHGIDVIVTDHHLAADRLPDAVAVVNPNQPGDTFKSKALAGCGVIFYVMLALRAALREMNWFEEQGLPEPNMANLLDIVALGSVADMVPLDANNRILIDQGLRRIRQGQCIAGIRALLQLGKRKLSQVYATDLGFAVAPRLNAAGRLEDMSVGVACLLTDNESEAMQLATRLDALNLERRELESTMKEQAFAALKRFEGMRGDDLPMSLSLYDESWHQGVTGIIAGRIKDKFHRPTVVFAQGEPGQLKASARSIAGVHIRDALEAVHKAHPDLLVKFGGHAMAAGLTIDENDFKAFKQAFETAVSAVVTQDALECVIESDGELAARELNLELAKLIQEAGPWGQAFAEPLFHDEFVVLEQRIVGANHLKLLLRKDDKTLDAIAFGVNLDHWPNHRCERILAAYRLNVNEFRGRQTVQLMVEYLEPA
ncbi:MAG: single-stranded-DNA-specific exonuclease RecJ [Gammaproteobacteria bacterium CG11_big_fil_rev_8_21_14_0_20_46_22]|nr:MAG: single-stranded-DNA-specific exonuclease RecJ [Gammaproteobacteria bacterium CG12_big_fil_rev_8_21_14_0_65_46_12]PIR11987.1 MAG: single-stranded-DNA-specific exonuclease RecJ [Gammaproteobacteria bacterium CG11_big_fil_rev_8_21_14_0_20_46_22]